MQILKKNFGVNLGTKEFFLIYHLDVIMMSYIPQKTHIKLCITRQNDILSTPPQSGINQDSSGTNHENPDIVLEMRITLLPNLPHNVFYLMDINPM